MLHHNCNSAPQSITVQNSDAEGVICCLPTNLSHVIFFHHTSMGPLSLSLCINLSRNLRSPGHHCHV